MFGVFIFAKINLKDHCRIKKFTNNQSKNILIKKFTFSEHKILKYQYCGRLNAIATLTSQNLITQKTAKM